MKKKKQKKRLNFVAWNRAQPMLLPVDLRDWVPDDSLAHFVAEAVKHVPLGKFRFNRRGTGSRQYHPRMMLALLMFCYSMGIFSSRRIEAATYRDVAVRYLVADNHPDHDTIAKFRRENGPAFREMFLWVLKLAAEMGVMRLGTVSVDGTKIDANASKHRSVSYERAGELDGQLGLAVDQMMERAEQAAQSEEPVADSLPDELAGAKRLQAGVRRARKVIESQARARDEAERGKIEAACQPPPVSDAPADTLSGSLDLGDAPAAMAEPAPATEPAPAADAHGGAETPPAGAGAEGSADAPADAPRADPAGNPWGRPKPTDHYNFTDPDSRLMRHTRHHAVRQAYNAQAAVDTGSHLIVGARVSQCANDRQELASSVAAIPAALGVPKTVLADNGYASETQAQALRDRNIEPLIAVGAEGRRRPYDLRPQPPPRKPRRVRSKFLLDMAEKLKSEPGRSLYKLRQQTVEPVFGTIKAAMGFRRFLLRGLDKVETEWQLVALAYNLRRMHNIGAPRPA